MKRYASIFRCGRRGTDGLSCAMVSGRPGGAGRAGVRASAAEACDHTKAGEFTDVLRARHAEFDAAPTLEVSAALCLAICVAAPGGSALSGPFSAPPRANHARTIPAHP